jgi:hypothetical protein
MRDRHWSPSGARGNRVMLIAVPLVITMAVGLVLGLRFMGERNASVNLSTRGARAATATPAAPGTDSTRGRPTGTASATATTTPRQRPT